jgi:hypothetical protein
MQMSDTGLNAPGRREGSMAKLWTLAVLCVGYGAWIVLALPREAVVNAIPFVFWALLFAWLALRARNKRAQKALHPDAPASVDL